MTSYWFLFLLLAAVAVWAVVLFLLDRRDRKRK